MKTAFFKNIVWAVDTMEEAEFQQNAKALISALTRETEANVYPVHVLSYPLVDPEAKNNFSEAYLALSEKRLKELGKDGRILINRGGSTRGAVEHLLDYALEKEADVVVASTHSRGAVARFFMGSFAETLLLTSEVPVITLNPHTKVREKIAKILLPTTFHEKYRAGFHQAVELSSILGASLTLLYKEPYVAMLEPSAELYKLLDEEAVAREREADLCREWARRYHVRLEVRMDNEPGDVAAEIEEYATKHKFDLIAMISQTSEFDGPRVGAICRKVVRSAQCPVWTLKTDEDLENEIG